MVMYRNIFKRVFLLALLLPWGCGQREGTSSREEGLPNIIFILADDLGYGDPGCYGQEKILTPNIDRLASEGIRFTRHYAGSTVCAPSRSVLMTGLHTGHTFIRGNREVQPEGQVPLPDSILTLPEILKQAGYVTGAFGKWGLGYPGSEGDPQNQGFDHFFGYNCQRYAHRYYPAYLWEDGRKVDLEGNDWTRKVTYAPDLIQEKTLDFIRQYSDTTFFAFVPVTIPHAELVVPEDSIFHHYRGKFPETPYEGRPGADYGPDMVIGMYCSQEYPHATFAAMVSRLDLYVGQIMETLAELGIADNTMIMFSSDNGPHHEGGADPGFFNSNGGLRGIKRDLYEGGIRVPFIVSWPGKISNGRVSAHMSAFWDLMPTLADLTGAEVEETDGISFLPELMGEEQPAHPYLYWEFHEQGGKQAVLQGDWKAVRLNVAEDPQGEPELYNLAESSSEQHNVAAGHPEVVKQMKRLMEEARTPSDLFNFGSSTYSGE